MKAIDLLEWVVSESISGEDLLILNIPQDADDEWFVNALGNKPDKKLTEGKYLLYYESSLGIEWIVTRFGKQEPDATIDAGYTDAKECWDYIHLYKLED